MAIQDEAFVKTFLRPWNEHDVEGIMSLMTDDCIWEIPRGTEPHGTLFKGATQVRAAIADAFKAMPDIRYELVHGSYGPAHMVLELLVTATRDGKPTKFHACDVMTIRGGKVAAKRSYRKVVE